MARDSQSSNGCSIRFVIGDIPLASDPEASQGAKALALPTCFDFGMIDPWRLAISSSATRQRIVVGLSG